jgi:hypothetical protein
MRNILPSLIVAATCGWSSAATVVTHPYCGVTVTDRMETAPRAVRMNVVQIDLTAAGVRFEVAAARAAVESGRETVRQTAVEVLSRKHAQLAINGNFFVPFPSNDTAANVVGFAASNGDVISAFEPQPVPGESGMPDQGYAIVPYAPALNIDARNHASIVHRNPACDDNKHVVEPVGLYNAISGSAQIIAEGVKTVPTYKDAEHPDGLLRANDTYSNERSWYSLRDARSVVGLTRDGRTLVLFTVDKAAGSEGMTPGEIADLLIAGYGVFNAINLDGGGSTSLAMADPVTHEGRLLNVSSDSVGGRSVGSSLVVFAEPILFTNGTRLLQNADGTRSVPATTGCGDSSNRYSTSRPRRGAGLEYRRGRGLGRPALRKAD